MPLTFPRDMTTAYNWVSGRPTLLRRQETSRTANRTQVRDLAPPLWSVEYETQPMREDEADAYEADLMTLGGALRTFFAHPASRPMPAAYETGNIGNLTIHSISPDRSEVRIAGLPEGMRLTAGDFISVKSGSGGRDLLRCASNAPMSFDEGVSTWVDVVPHVRPKITVGMSASMNLPLFEARLEPGSLGARRIDWGVYAVTFTATQVLR